MRRNTSFMRRLHMFSMGSAMADIALLLLVFFMATTTTEPPKGAEVELPVALTRGAEQDSLYITIARNGDIYFDSKRADIESLKDQLAMRHGEIDRPVALTADRTLPYSRIREVLDILREKEFLNVVFMSTPRQDQ